MKFVSMRCTNCDVELDIGPEIEIDYKRREGNNYEWLIIRPVHKQNIFYGVSAYKSIRRRISRGCFVYAFPGAFINDQRTV